MAGGPIRFPDLRNGVTIMSDFAIEDFADPLRELARRVTGGVEATLYWSPHDNSTTVEVWQPASGELLVFDVPPERALEAYYHPFAEFAPSFDELVPVADA
jgi:hypothetical protein